MAQRLHDAVAEIRVLFTEHQTSHEFLARVKAERYTPMVVDFQRDSGDEKKGGGVIRMESRAPILVSRRVIDCLPYEVDETIDRWLMAKRRELREAAAAKCAEGATSIRINERGEVRRA